MKSIARIASAWERRKLAQVIGGSLWGWVDAVGLEDLPDGGWCDPDAEEGEFAVDALGVKGAQVQILSSRQVRTIERRG
ncbi:MULTISPECIES: hypothetical protein [unclassified Streptomyces]|uniref:hypothetical protein n=1 Tax=unclassified Streptomyces TaxID=2593676 RepID=UPI00278C7AA1|nr:MULTISPECIES: hypothetical protein [unclassified Streptomyces]